MKRIIPYGDRILVQRRKVGDKLSEKSALILPDQVADRPTDVADVVYVPDQTFCDKVLLENAESIIKGLTEMAKDGDSESMLALIKYNDYLRLKSIKPGDVLLVGKYVGTDFNVKETGESLTVMEYDGIYAKIVDVK